MPKKINNLQYKSPVVGQEISCVLKGIDKSYLSNNKKLDSLIIKILREEKFNICDVSSYSFKPRGYTLLVLLKESHLALHTYPEYDSVYFSIYSCRGPNDSLETFEKVKKALNPKELIHYTNNKIKVL